MTNESIAEKLVKFWLSTVVLVGAIILQGWVISVLWGWFVASTFGVAQLSIPVAIGIRGLVGLVKVNYNIKKETPETDWPATLTMHVLVPMFALLAGWITTLFM